MRKAEKARKSSSRGTLTLGSVRQQGALTGRLPSPTLSQAQTERLKAGPLRAPSKFPSFGRNVWSASYKQGIVLF